MTLGNYFFPGWFADCRQLCQFPLVVKYSIWTRGVRHHKVPNEPQTLDPFTEWLNFMFKYTNINFKNGTLLLWNLWLVCGKMINSSLESAVCKTPHIIKHSGRYNNFHPIVITTCDYTKAFSSWWCNQNFEFPSFTQVTGAPWFHEYAWMKIKIRACKLGSENTSCIRKYHKYDKMDRKIRNCEILSIECKKLDVNT